MQDFIFIIHKFIMKRGGLMLEIPKLEEITFVNGSYQKLVFHVDTQNGEKLPWAGTTIKWILCRIGCEDDPLITKTSTPSSGISIAGQGEFFVELLASDTLGLKGKFIHRPIIEQGSGRTHIPVEGYIVIN